MLEVKGVFNGASNTGAAPSLRLHASLGNAAAWKIWSATVRLASSDPALLIDVRMLRARSGGGRITSQLP